MGGETGDNESAAYAQKERASFPLPHPLQGTKLNPQTHRATLSLQRLELGRKEEEIAFAFVGPSPPGVSAFPLLCPHWSIHLTTECLLSARSCACLMGVSKGVRKLLLSKEFTA